MNLRHLLGTNLCHLLHRQRLFRIPQIINLLALTKGLSEKHFDPGARRHSEKSSSSVDPVYRIGMVGDESAASQFRKHYSQLHNG